MECHTRANTRSMSARPMPTAICSRSDQQWNFGGYGNNGVQRVNVVVR